MVGTRGGHERNDVSAYGGTRGLVRILAVCMFRLDVDRVESLCVCFRV